MNREKLKELEVEIVQMRYGISPTLKFLELNPLKNAEFILKLIDILLEDDKPKTATEVVMKEEYQKEIERFEDDRPKSITEELRGKIPVRETRHDWTPEEVKAIRESIIHWRDNVSRLKLADELGIEFAKFVLEHWIDVNTKKTIAYFNAGHCSLCITYRRGDDCSDCPLFRSGNWCKPENSAWGKCVSARGNEEIISSTENMVSVLESLLE